MSEDENNSIFWLAILSLCEQATHDGLTGLKNRRYFEETLKDHIASARRYDRALSLVLFDIDEFKAINDANGHAAGDTVLKHFAEVLGTTARAADILCRVGGDEFAVILPETHAENARRFVDRVRAKQPYPTVSAGIAALPAGNLYAEADADLIVRKKESRR